MAVTTQQVVAQSNEAPEPLDYARTGPGTLAGQYMRRFWHPIQVADELPAGRAKPIRILGEDLTLYRGEGGEAHLLAFRCAHRGTQLSTGWVEGDEIRCFYHGWKYDGAGHCTEQPAEPEPFCSRIRIRSYPLQEYLGLIWAYLGDGEPPAMRRFRQLEDESATDIRNLGPTRMVPYNYANLMENDPAHVPFVHRGTPFFQDIPLVAAEEMEYGSKETVTFSNRVGYVHRIMPHGRMFVVPVAEGGWTEGLHWQVPVDDEHHLWFAIQMNHVKPEGVEQFRERVARIRGNPAWVTLPVELSERVLRGELRIEDAAEEGMNLVNLQDTVSQWGQGTVRDASQDRLGRSDSGVLMLRKLWERELRNLAEGRPLKEWTIPERIELTANYHG